MVERGEHALRENTPHTHDKKNIPQGQLQRPSREDKALIYLGITGVALDRFIYKWSIRVTNETEGKGGKSNQYADKEG